MHILTWGLGLGLDSFVACLAIGWHRLSWHDKFALSATFGVSDMVTSAWGSLYLHATVSPPPLIGYVFCAYLLGLAARENRTRLYLLPIVLSVDNFLSGNAIATAPLLGISSAAMALLGLSLAAALQHAFLKGEAAT